MKSIALLATFLACSEAFTTSTPAFTRTTSELSMAVSSSNINEVSRSNFLQFAGAAAVSTLISSSQPAFAEDESISLPSGTSYVITKPGDGPKPDIGEMAAIRFKANVKGGNQIDDIFDKPEPYYTRIGSGGLIKGVEEVLPKMRVGDRFFITVPTSMAFGPKGRPASAGKPRIPGDAIIEFEVEMVGLPGKETELIELIGDD
eukprot:CAMPEP_0184856564 /NCGR_PEP_ID=MMETSP0580-20130426/1758_1 /TAXON_ID=1118495 /ORGANISM="Dactyliosolen fragilissimus" /LENGTH=202 /DNA_ID=CAMNT_0027351667 /DNA_START=79 /DNA_END=687 /DNA_ORIENTATION=+